MSFNETIGQDSFQAGSGTANNGAYAQLAGVTDAPSYKAVWIVNNGATNNLFISISSLSLGAFGYRLPPGKMIELQFKRADIIEVAGDGGSTTYSWLAY